MSQQIASLYAKIGADTSGFEQGMASAHKSLNSFGSLLGGLATGAVVAAGAAIVGLGAAIGVSTMKAAGFEQSIADIASTMGKTSAEIAPLKKLIMDLGLDPKLKVSTDEAAAAVANLVKNGLTMDQVLQGAARSTVLLANATGADFGTAANIATDVMQQFNIAAGDMDSAVNGILGVTQASKFGIQDYQNAIAMAGGVASSVGVGFEDFNATIAATAFNFNSGSDAGTSFKTFLQRLVPQSKEATTQMRELGIITADGANRFFDANGQMKSMVDIADILQDAFAGLSEEQAINAASTMFGTDAMRTSFALAKVGGEEISKMKGIIGDTSAEDAAAVRMDTLSGQWEIFMGVVEAASIQIGTAFLPAAKKIVEWAQAAADKYLPDVIVWFERFAAWVIEALPKVEAFIVKLGGWAQAFLDWATGSNDSLNVVATAASWMMAKVSESFGALMDWVRKNLPAWMDTLKQWGYAAGSWIMDTGWPMLWANLKKWSANLWEWIVAEYPKWVANLKQWGTASGTWIIETGWPLLAANLAKWGGQLVDWLKAQLPTFVRVLAEWAVQLGAWVIDGIAYCIDALRMGADAVSKWLSGTGKNNVEKGIFTWVAPLWEWVMDDLWPMLKPALGHLFEAVLKIIGASGKLIWEAFWAIARGIVNTFEDALASVWKGFVDWWVGGWRDFVGLLSDIWKLFRDFPKQIIEGFKQGFQDRWDGFKQFWKDAWQNLVEIPQNLFGIHSPSTVFAGYGVNVMEGFAGGIHVGMPIVERAMEGMGKVVTTVVAGMYDKLNAATAEIALRATYATKAAAEMANTASQSAYAARMAEQERAAAAEAEREIASAIAQQKIYDDYYAAMKAEREANAAAVPPTLPPSQAALIADRFDNFNYTNTAQSVQGYESSDVSAAVALLNRLQTAQGVVEEATNRGITIDKFIVNSTGNAVNDIIQAINFLNSSYSYGY